MYFKIMHYDSTLDVINAIIKIEEKLNRFLQLDRELILGTDNLLTSGKGESVVTRGTTAVAILDEIERVKYAGLES